MPSNRTVSPFGRLSISSETISTRIRNNTSVNSDTVASNQWQWNGILQMAVGRLYLEMPNNIGRKGPWTGYVCSGTVVTDGTDGRSIIITAAHCIYDDVNKAFARNVMFVPGYSKKRESGGGSNRSCMPSGCWVPSFGAVDVNWTIRTFPANIAWDYGYYVFNDHGAHLAPSTQRLTHGALDSAVRSLPVSFTTVALYNEDTGASNTDYTYALGLSEDPEVKLNYCAEHVAAEPTRNVGWWLGHCRLSGGVLGGPWIQLKKTGAGSIISVNSWGYTNHVGMSGPKLVGTSASCVFEHAKAKTFPSARIIDGEAGIKAICR